MIRPEKQKDALRAIQQVIIVARHLSSLDEYKGKVTKLLDEAEYPPQLMLEPEDETETFSDVIKEISERYPGCGGIFIKYCHEVEPEPAKPEAHQG